MIFGKKSHNAEKTERDPLRFSTSSRSQNSKQIEGGPFGGKFFQKKSRSAKKIERGPFGLARCGMLRGKTGKTFLVQFARPNGAVWCNKILRTFKNYFGQFVCIEKKSHYNSSRVSLHEAPINKRHGIKY